MQKILDSINEVQEVMPYDMVLLEQASLCTTSKLPMSCCELDLLLWKAFHLGKKYRDKGGKE